MALTDAQWNTIQRRSGVPRHVMEVLLNRGERSSQSSVSPAGAFGRAQLMPATAASLSRQYGVNPRTEFGNVLLGAMYLGSQKRTFGSWKLAFAAYNAGGGAVSKYHGVPPFKETQDYVRRTMSALQAGGGGDAPAAAPSRQRGAGGSLGTFSTPDLTALARQSQQDILEGDWDPLKTQQSILEMEQQGEKLGRRLATPTSRTPTGRGNKLGVVTFAANADRPGVHTQQDIIDFAKSVSHVFGAPLQVGTGTRHSQMTVNGNQSQHWTGEAVDIPAVGRKLIRMGQAALIAAGADPRWARRQSGGLFNVHGRQIIFNTHEGGDHTNHLHLGA